MKDVEEGIDEVKDESEEVQSSWKRSRTEKAGKRFTKLHRLRRAKSSRRPQWLSPLVVVVAILLLALSVVFTIIPGPNWLFFIPGSALLAIESGMIARKLDVCEKVAEPLLQRCRKSLDSLPPACRWLILGGASVVAFGFTMASLL